jgi:DNA polymerase I
MLKVKFPNSRACIIPDSGCTFFDIDLEGADARVVAWDADDEDLMRAFEARLKIHAKNALDVFGPKLAGPDGLKEPTYTRTKRAVHATHYGAREPALARKCKMTMQEATFFRKQWLTVLHPNIGRWMSDIEHELQTTGGVRNKFGYGINFFQRGTDAYTSALSWKPQSTVARVCEIAMVRLGKYVPDFVKVLQNHDSLGAQIRNDRITRTLREVDKVLADIVVPYDKPLVIPWGIKSSRVSWGDCKKDSWSKYIDPTQPVDEEVAELDKPVHELHGGHGGSASLPLLGGDRNDSLVS